MDNNEMVSPASEEFEALLPEGWAGEGDFFDESTWGAETGTGADESQDGGADMAENDAGIDDNGGSPTTEDGAVDGGETDTAGADGASDGEQSQASPSKLKFSAKLDHQFKDVELDEAELPTIYQKAYATDRAQEKLAKLQPMQEKGDRLAALLGFDSMDAMLNSAEQNYLDTEIAKLTDEGVHPEVAKDIVTRRVQDAKNRPAAADTTTGTETAEPGERDFTSEVASLLSVHPELKGKRLPEEVVHDCVRNNRPLVQAYTDYESKQRKAEAEALRKENNTLKQNAEAARRAPVRGVAGGGVTSKPDDPFLAGFNSDDW